MEVSCVTSSMNDEAANGPAPLTLTRFTSAVESLVNRVSVRDQLTIVLPPALRIRCSFGSRGTMTPSNMSTNNATATSPEKIVYSGALITIYVVVLVAGSVGLVLMASILKTNLRSWTSITLLNLIFAHLIFLLTVPFRIYYYATSRWDLGLFACKLVSATIHIHMYVVFVIYVIILAVHFLHYHKKIEQMEFERSFHAMAVSAGIWSVLIVVCPIVMCNYGTMTTDDQHKCFNFGKELNNQVTRGFNVVLSLGTILVSIILSCALAVILRSVVKKHGPASWARQEFWAQMKNVSLMLIIIMCLVPYHLYRLFYLNHSSEMEAGNEMFLAITTVTCFDMLLLFSGKGICQRCGVFDR